MPLLMVQYLYFNNDSHYYNSLYFCLLVCVFVCLFINYSQMIGPKGLKFSGCDGRSSWRHYDENLVKIGFLNNSSHIIGPKLFRV